MSLQLGQPPRIGVKEYFVPDGQQQVCVVQTYKSYASIVGELVVAVPSGADLVSLSRSGGSWIALQPQNGNTEAWTTTHQEFTGVSPNTTWTAIINPVPPPGTIFMVMNYSVY